MKDTENIYYVLASDKKTDTAIIAESVSDVYHKMENNRYWKQNGLRPIKIKKLFHKNCLSDIKITYSGR